MDRGRLGAKWIAALLVAASCAPLAAQSFLPGVNPFAPRPPAATPAAGAPAAPPLPATSGPAASGPATGSSPASATNSSAAPTNAPAAAIEPMATRSYRFTIPYTLTPPRDPAEAPVEVQLFVTTDRGANWRMHTKVPPNTTNFDFSAPGDGEYWFMSKTIDRTGRQKPATGYRPELKVIVDTKAPRLNLTATSGAGGDVTAVWEAFDDLLVASSLQLSYQVGPKDPWQPVAVEVPNGDAARTSISGSTPFIPQNAGDSITVRAEIRDKAGNPTVVHRQVTMTRVANRGHVIASNPAGGFNNPGFNNPHAQPASPSVPAWPATSDKPKTEGAWTPSTTGWAPPSPEKFAGSNPSPYGGGPVAAPVQPPVASQVGSPVTPPGYSPSGPAPSPTAGTRPLMTTGRRFNLTYDIESVGPLGVAKVELWGTRDSGQTWENWGVDDDKRTPFVVEVPREGTFGFRIVVAGNNGLVGDTPRSGEPADVWVSVDWTKPVGQITGAQYGQGQNAGALEIQWQAADAQQNLGEKPITLKFGESPNGPWNTIATGLPNNGSYLWRVDARVPPHIFLRLEVRDEAGNVGTHELTEPISTRALLPKAKILELQPTVIEGTPGAYRLKTVR